ncbi:MAG: tetratricopeptide repeat protein [Nodosilinea sp.]
MEMLLRDRPTAPVDDRPRTRPKARVAKPSFDPQTEAIRLCEIGKILLNAGRFEAALAQFEKALACQSHDVESWYGRAEALAALNRYEAALHSLEQAQALANLDEPRLWVQKAIILIALHHPQAALTHCNCALWLEPNHVQAWLFRGVALQQLGRDQEAQRSYRRASHRATATLHDHMSQLCHDLALE